MQISELLGKKYLEKFKVFYPITLFPPNWNALLKNHCPICGNKLKIARVNKIAYCRSVKHKKPFVISIERLREVILKKKTEKK